MLLSPFVVMFVYPAFFLVAMYVTAIFLHVYRHRMQQIYSTVAELHFWEGAQQTVAAFFDAHGTYWHGENLFTLFSCLPQVFVIYYSMSIQSFVEKRLKVSLLRCEFFFCQGHTAELRLVLGRVTSGHRKRAVRQEFLKDL